MTVVEYACPKCLVPLTRATLGHIDRCAEPYARAPMMQEDQGTAECTSGEQATLRRGMDSVWPWSTTDERRRGTRMRP